MPTMTIRNFAAIAATTSLALVGAPAWAATVTAPLNVNIVGADSLCSGWTTGVNTATGALTLTCIPSTPSAPGTPGTCTINGSLGTSLTGTVGTPVTLTAACSGATGYVWTSVNGTCASSNAQACAASATAAGLATYTVRGTNGGLTGSGTNASVQWSAGTSLPAPTGPISCSSQGFRNTIAYDMPWKSTGSTNPRFTTSGFDGSTAVVLRFTVPAAYRSTTLSRISGVEYGGGPIRRTSAVSRQPCDFGDSGALPAQNVLKGAAIAAFWLQIGGSSTSNVVVEPGQTYYMNIRNTDRYGASSCTTQAYCNMAFTVTVP